MDEFAFLSGPVENADRSRRRTLDDGEGQRRIHRKGLEDLEHHDARAAVIVQVQAEACRRGVVADRASGGLANQPTTTVVVLPGGEFFRESRWRPRGAVRELNDRTERCVVEDRLSGHEVLLFMRVETTPPRVGGRRRDRLGWTQ
ncbi:hypothetical protein GW17_00055084 [Ensete ventricosum]|nr:hypothetical protein GW17_00055084 [Ensete ventricosum]